MAEGSTKDAALFGRLRDLSLVDVDALLAGAEVQQYVELLDSFAADLDHALKMARTRMAELATTTAGPDPLTVVDMAAAVRAQDGGREAGERATRRLAERAAARRTLAVYDDLTGQLLSRLFEVDRRRAQP